jgi:hypothetical protein
MQEDTQILTNSEPVIVEQNNNVQPEVVEQPVNIQTTTQVTEQPISQPTEPVASSVVIEQPTPTDNNVTYNNISIPHINIEGGTEGDNLLAAMTQTARNIELDSNSGSAINRFLTEEYDYDKNEAGSYWVAGNINDNETQMGFLNTLINEEMYDTMDLQKYYYDTQLATARAYAAQKNKETAYGFYKAAKEKAFAEGELTGWYMPAEGRYMLNQYNVAEDKLNDMNSTEEDKFKANRVKKVTEQWFAANKITPRGIKCLSMMNYEENVRYNSIMGELKKEGNRIALSQAGASGAAASYALRLYKYRQEEMEMARGLDIDENGIIGHNGADYADIVNSDEANSMRGYKSVGDVLSQPDMYTKILTNDEFNTDRIDQALKKIGLDPQEFKNKYDRDTSKINNMDILDKNGYYSSDNLTETNLYKDGKQLYRANGENGQHVWTKDENGNFKEITTSINSKTELVKDGEVVKAGDYFKDISTEKFTIDGKEIKVNKSTTGSVEQRELLGSGYSKKEIEAFNKVDKDIYTYEQGAWSDQGVNSNIVFSTLDSKNNKVYWTIEKDGEFKQVGSGTINYLDFKDIKPGDYIDNVIDYEYSFKEDGSKTSNWTSGPGNFRDSAKIKTDLYYNGERAYSLTDSKGNIIYFINTGDGSHNDDRYHIVVSPTELKNKDGSVAKDVPTSINTVDTKTDTKPDTKKETSNNSKIDNSVSLNISSSGSKGSGLVDQQDTVKRDKVTKVSSSNKNDKDNLSDLQLGNLEYKFETPKKKTINDVKVVI